MDSEQLGQLLLTGVPGAELDPDTAARFKKLQPGGFILFGRNIKSAEQLRKLTDDLSRMDFDAILTKHGQAMQRKLDAAAKKLLRIPQ